MIRLEYSPDVTYYFQDDLTKQDILSMLITAYAVPEDIALGLVEEQLGSEKKSRPGMVFHPGDLDRVVGNNGCDTGWY